MYTINAETIGEAHEKIVGLILRDGEYIVTENNEQTLELPEPLIVHVSHPLHDPIASPASRFGPQARGQYVEKVLNITPRKNDGNDAVYTYGNRLWDYPTIDEDGDFYGDGSGPRGTDQLPPTIDKLVGHPTTRRAIMHTWNVALDLYNPEPPCIQTIQFFNRGGHINLVTYIRSNDMLSAWSLNALALSAILRKVGAQVSVPPGWIETISASAHIYHKRDETELNAFRQRIGV